MPIIGAVSDDLTGGTTVGVLLARSGSQTVVFFNEKAALVSDNLDNYQSIVISSNSRPNTPDFAYEKVVDATKALRQMGVKYFSKRTDTTLRGGIGFEIDAMLDELEEGMIAIVVPSMPQSKRILVGGYSIIDSVALIKTPVAQDVRTPVKDNYIPRLLGSQTKRNVSLISMDTVLQGSEAIKKALEEKKSEGSTVIVIDSISLEDINAIAKAVVQLDWNVLAVDPGTFTQQLGFERGLFPKDYNRILKDKKEEVDNKIVIVAAGSATPVTKMQIGRLLEKDTRNIQISVNPKNLIKGGEMAEEEVQRCVKLVLEKMDETIKPRVIVLETALHDSLLDLEEQDKLNGYVHGMSANRINSALGVIIGEVVDNVGRERMAGIYTTGGDTMVNVCYQLGAECIEVIDYVIPQADFGKIVGGKYDGLPMIGKGGLTGEEDTAIEIIERLFLEASYVN